MRVCNLTSPRTGREVANQLEIVDNNGVRWFQSYQSIICKRDGREIVLDSYYWDYSRTTSKYRNQFLGMTTDEIKKAISAGRIKLANLN